MLFSYSKKITIQKFKMKKKDKKKDEKLILKIDI